MIVRAAELRACNMLCVTMTVVMPDFFTTLW